MTNQQPNSDIASPDPEAIARYLLDTFPGVETTAAMGYTFFFYGSDHKLPFVTIATQDNEYDRASHLDRPSVFRLNIGVSRDSYRALFGPPPAPPGEAGVVATGHDFAALDQLMPHPVYAPQSWVCVLNPSAATFRGLQPVLAEAYARASNRHARHERGA